MITPADIATVRALQPGPKPANYLQGACSLRFSVLCAWLGFEEARHLTELLLSRDTLQPQWPPSITYAAFLEAEKEHASRSTQMTYTTHDFLHAIAREQAKRVTTFPKLIQKMEREDATPKRISTACARMALQNARLLSVYNVLRDGVDLDAESAIILSAELYREMKMRETVYKRFVMLRRITPEAAEEQVAVWRALVRHLAEKYITAPGPAG